MRSTVKRLSAMILAVLMVVTMASLLAVSAAIKPGARTLGSIESLTLGTSANYAGLATTANGAGAFFADSIGLWGFNGVTSYAPLSNQTGIDILVDPTLGLSGGKWINKNIYIDLSAWSNPTNSAKWAKYGTTSITIGFLASYDSTTKLLTWTAVPATGNNANDMLQFFTFQVDTAGANQIQLFQTDLVAQITTTTGDTGVWNVYFQECRKTTSTTPGAVLTGLGYVYNMDGEVALWNDMFHGTHAFTKLFGFEYGVAGQIGYNTKDTTAAVDFMLTAGSLVTNQWDVVAGAYANTTTTPTVLDLSLLKKSFTSTAGTFAYNYDSWLAFVTMRNSTTGYAFTVTMADPRIGSTTLVPSDAMVTYTFTGLKGNLRLSWTTANAVTGLQTATAAGGENGNGNDFRIVGNQSQTLTAAELEAGKLLYWEQVPYISGVQPFGTTIQWPTNQNNYLKITYKTVRAAQADWNFDTKIKAVAADMNLVDATRAGNVDLQLRPVISPTSPAPIAGLLSTDGAGKKLRDYGHTLNYYVEYTSDCMTQMVIDIHNNTLDGLTTTHGAAKLWVNITKGTMVSAFECQITQYDETFVVPLQDGTFTLMRIKVKTNYDDVASPLAPAAITDFNYSRLTFVEQIKFYNDRLYDANGVRVYNSNANKVIYIDMINGIPGSGTAYWNDKAFRPNVPSGVQYYTKLTALLSYVGFNVDGSKPVRNPVGYSKFYNTIDTTLSLTAKQLWDSSFRMTYEKGTGTAKESIAVVIYPLTPAQTLNYVAADGNTYVYSLFFHTQYGDMPVAAASLGVAQKSEAKITAMGEYTYAIAASTTDTGAGFAVGALTKVEKKGTITITNYWDNTRGLNNAVGSLSNYNKAITVLAVRIPAGSTVATSAPAAGVEARVVALQYGTLGLNTVDGLVDAYITIEYSTIANSTFTLTVNYDDGPNDGLKGYTGFSRTWDVTTTWVVRTSSDPDTTNAASVAYNKFTSTLGKTLTPAAAVMPSNPNEATLPSSTPSVTSVVSAPSDTSTPAMGNPFNAIAYIITIGASAIGGISTLVLRKKK